MAPFTMMTGNVLHEVELHLSLFESGSTMLGGPASYGRTADFDPQIDVLVVQGRPAGGSYSRVLWWTEHDGTWLYLSLACLLPVFRGQGIGTAMLQWGRAADTADRRRSYPRWQGRVRSQRLKHRAEAADLLRHAGYAVASRWVELGIDSCGSSCCPITAAVASRVHEAAPMMDPTPQKKRLAARWWAHSAHGQKLQSLSARAGTTKPAVAFLKSG